MGLLVASGERLLQAKFATGHSQGWGSTMLKGREQISSLSRNHPNVSSRFMPSTHSQQFLFSMHRSCPSSYETCMHTTRGAVCSVLCWPGQVVATFHSCSGANLEQFLSAVASYGLQGCNKQLAWLAAAVHQQRVQW